MVNEATIEAYKAMAKDSACPSMEAQIRENLERTCDKFAGNEDKFDRCISYLEECAQEILEGKNGDVPDEVCFRICRDYFNDEIWKKEDEKAAQAKAEADERAAEAAEAKKKAAEEKKAAAAAIKKTAAEARKAETLARKKAEEERKAAELKKMQEEAAREAKAADELKKSEEARKADMCHGQLDLFAMLGA